MQATAEKGTLSTGFQPARALMAASQESAGQGRLPGLDMARACSILLVVSFHAAVPYLMYPLPGLHWPVRSPIPSIVADSFNWWRIFSLSLLFFLAGFNANGLCQARGNRYFLAHRARTLLVPLMLGIAIVLPLTAVAGAIARTVAGDGSLFETLKAFASKGFANPNWGLSHLWFLEYLCLYCLAAAAIHATGFLPPRTWFVDTPRRWLPAGSLSRGIGFLLLLLAVPPGIILAGDPHIILGFHQAFMPSISKLLYFGCFFAAGMVFPREGLAYLNAPRRITFLLALGLGLLAFLIPKIHSYLRDGLPLQDHCLLMAGLVFYSWVSTFGFLGLLTRLSRPGHPLVTFLAQASFWIYLVHIPFVILAQTAMSCLPLPITVQWLGSLVATVTLSSLTYRFWVRGTWIGEVLHGRWGTRENIRPPVGAENDSAPRRSAADRHAKNPVPYIAGRATAAMARA